MSTTERVLYFVTLAVVALLTVTVIKLVLVPLGLTGSLLVLTYIAAAGALAFGWSRVWPYFKKLVGID